MTFHGDYRGIGHPHESPSIMTWPLVLLAVPAAFFGFFNLTGNFNALGGGEHMEWFAGLFGVFTHPLTWVSLALAGCGIYLAYAVYEKKYLSADNIRNRFQSVYLILRHKYGLMNCTRTLL